MILGILMEGSLGGVLPWPMRRTWAMGIGASVARTVIYESISKMRETAMKPN